MENKFTKAFTLVELIVVITILAVLATIGFISMTSYGISSRDAVRTTDLKNITKAFEFQKTKDIKLPLPDKKVDISASGSIFQHQGLLSENILAQNNIHGGGKDPQTGEYFGYVVNKNLDKFQIITFLENEENLVKNNVISEIYADNSNKFPKTSGDILGFILDENTNEIISTENGSNIDISNNSLNYGIIVQGEINSVTPAQLISRLKFRVNQNGSCYSILLNGKSKGDRVYTINPTGVEGEQFDVYCDMTTDGGGWTLVARGIAGEENYTSLADGIVSSPTQSTKARLSTEDIVKIGKASHEVYETRFLYDNISNTYYHEWNNGHAGDFETKALGTEPFSQSYRNNYSDSNTNLVVNPVTGCGGGFSPFRGSSQCATIWRYAGKCQTGFGFSASCANSWVEGKQEDSSHRSGTFWVK